MAELYTGEVTIYTISWQCRAKTDGELCNRIHVSKFIETKTEYADWESFVYECDCGIQYKNFNTIPDRYIRRKKTETRIVENEELEPWIAHCKGNKHIVEFTDTKETSDILRKHIMQERLLQEQISNMARKKRR